MNDTPIKPTHSHGGSRVNAGRKAHYQEKTVVMRVPASKVDAVKSWLKPSKPKDMDSIQNIQKIETKTKLELVFPMESVAAGFPSPAQDDIERTLDLNEYLVKHPLSSFILTVHSLSMRDAGIEIGDQIIIDRSLMAEHGDIVLALLNNEFTVKRLMRNKNDLYDFWLKAENPEFPDIYPREHDNLKVWGVVTCILKKLK